MANTVPEPSTTIALVPEVPWSIARTQDMRYTMAARSSVVTFETAPVDLSDQMRATALDASLLTNTRSRPPSRCQVPKRALAELK